MLHQVLYGKGQHMLVYDEIHEKKLPLFWSNTEIIYNAFMLSMYFGLWIYCFYYAKDLSYWWMVLLAVMNTGICNHIFHETSHYTGFKNQKRSKYGNSRSIHL